MLCECGCGQQTRICTHTSSARGVVKGQHMRFVSGHNRPKERSSVCPKGHRRDGACSECAAEYSRLRRLTPEGKTERCLEHLKARGKLNAQELLRAKPVILTFFKRIAQEQVCAICGDNCSGKKKFAADHDHETKKFRDMICQECNTALGHSRERLDLLG
jgi:Recombination endonuclease VII